MGPAEDLQRRDRAGDRSLARAEIGGADQRRLGEAVDRLEWLPWAADRCFQGGRPLESAVAVAQASPTLYDQQLYRTARAGKELPVQRAGDARALHGASEVRRVVAEEAGKRPMNIEVNGRPVRERWDPAAAAGQPNMAADVRVEDITPDAAGHITVRIIAAGANDAILQAIEIQ